MSKKRKIPQHIKEEVWRLYGSSLCWCCQQEPISAKNKHFGHIIAETNGGTETLDNLRPVCQNCNLRMGTRNMYDFMIANAYPIRNIAIIERLIRSKHIKLQRLKGKLVFFIPMHKGSPKYDCAIGTKSLLQKHPYLKPINLKKLFTCSTIEDIHFYFITNNTYCNYVKYKQQQIDMKQIERELII